MSVEMLDCGCPVVKHAPAGGCLGHDVFENSFLEHVVVAPSQYDGTCRRMAADILRLRAAAGAPIPMILTCPSCSARHVDAGEFATKPHHTHACQSCGTTWRPAIVATVGVQFLPGFKDVTWRPMAEARKDGTPVLLKLLDPIPGRPDMEHFGGLQFVGRHLGVKDPTGIIKRYDPGWNFAAPVGMGGFPDEWFEGWRPLP